MKHHTQTGGRVLIADDDPGIRRTMRRVLERAGYEVLLAADGEEALERIAEHACDVLVSDLIMPRRDGMELLRALRSRDVDIPVVLMSSQDTDMLVAMEALERGVMSYLHKPFPPGDLTAAVGKALHRYRSVDSTARVLVEQERALDRVVTSCFVHRQPIVHWESRTVIGYECLLRAKEKSLPHPGAILEAAERFGRLHDLGRVVRQRCSATEGVDDDVKIFVNLHPLDLLDEELFDRTAPLAAMSHRVVLEITERSRLAEVKVAHDAVTRLREMGFQVAVDDIGAGFAGLSSLTLLEPDVVKLDMSLVRSVDQSRVKRHLVDTLVRICRDHGIGVVAEGVETPAELGTLLELGCDIFQGYLFARPQAGFPDPEWNVLSLAS